MSSTSISTPTQLAEEMKRTGEFDKLRKNLIAEFQSSPDQQLLFSRLDKLLSNRLTIPSTKSKNQQFVALTQEVESKQVLLQTSNEIMKRMKTGEIGLGSDYGNEIEKELLKLLKQSRGELDEDNTADMNME